MIIPAPTMEEFDDDRISGEFSSACPASIPQSSSSISLATHKLRSNPWPMVAIHDSSSPNSDLSIFPPSSHENLTPSHDHHAPLPSPLLAELEPEKAQLLASPISPFLFPRSNSDPSSSDQFDSDPDRSLPQSPTSGINIPPSMWVSESAVSRWWRVAFHIIRSKFGDFRSLFGRDSGRMVVWPLGNIWLAVAAAMWWLWYRERRRRRSIQRRNTVGQLLLIMREKDEKIVELLNQMGKMNEFLLSLKKP
ncbi:hypothetical protein LINGRAHAP2_LOCUS9702 [Linum grandiflorum]